MVETAAGQKNIPKEWTKNSGTKVYVPTTLSAIIDHYCRLKRAG